MRAIAIVQARVGSTRLPGKVLQPVLGAPMLVHVVSRCMRAALIDQVVVATTTQSRDDAIADLCAVRQWPCFRGSEDDVLGRYLGAARAFGAEAVVRITSDCPLSDPEVIDAHVSRLRSHWHEADLVTNMVRQTYPLGLAVEALPLDVLVRMDRMSVRPDLREHVTTLAYERPELFAIEHVLHGEDLSALRWTVDTPEDLALIRTIFEHFSHDRFSWREALVAFNRHAQWREINAQGAASRSGPSR
ncbi:MAG TPA: glycosyltransferase family protein [Steroidobacteraceae bacterium]|nr:glycosyltransferase family protein [Steroidobacteraceae bacterium]